MRISTRSYCYLLLWFGLIIICSELTPYFANDFRYMLVQGTHDFVASYQDIFVSQYQHYFEWGGRTVAHVIAQTLLFWGKPFSAVAQACCYVLLMLFIYYNAYGISPTLRLRFMPLFVISALLFMQLRVYGEVIFNIVSSANYLYTTTIVLMFLLPYRISMSRELCLSWYITWPMMMVLGVLAGWSNENTAAAVAAGLGLYLLYNLVQKRLRFWQCLGYAAFLVGFALLVFAPGNRARLDSMEEGGFDYVAHTIKAIGLFGEALMVSLILLLVLAYLYWKVREHFLQYARPDRYMGSMFFILTGFLALFLMIFSPNFPARSATPFTIFVIVGVIGLADILLSRGYDIVSTRCKWMLTTISAAFMIAAMTNIIYCSVILNEDFKVRNAEILQQIEQGKTDLVVSPMHVNTYKYIFVADVRATPDYWTNKIVTNFLEVNSIVRSCDYPQRSLMHDLVPFAFPEPDSACNLHPEAEPQPQPEAAPQPVPSAQPTAANAAANKEAEPVAEPEGTSLEATEAKEESVSVGATQEAQPVAEPKPVAEVTPEEEPVVEAKPATETTEAQDEVAPVKDTTEAEAVAEQEPVVEAEGTALEAEPVAESEATEAPDEVATVEAQTETQPVAE